MRAFKNFFFAWIFPWFPKRLLSRATGMVMRIYLPRPLRDVLLPLFAWFFKIRGEDAELPLARYKSFDDFFTRRLKPGLRPILAQHIHPVDAVLSQCGVITQGQLIQAKGWTYSLAEFLGDEELAHWYEGGTFATYYLCPADYHRVHTPLEGHLQTARHIPGLLWPVNEWSVNNIRRLFNLNERVVLNFKTDMGKSSMVLVGATNVGHMSITPDPSIITNRWLWHAPTDRTYTPPIAMKVGEEAGIFHLGSTVVCVYDKTYGVALPKTGPVRLGEAYSSR